MLSQGKVGYIPRQVVVGTSVGGSNQIGSVLAVGGWGYWCTVDDALLYGVSSKSKIRERMHQQHPILTQDVPVHALAGCWVSEWSELSE